MKAKDIQPRSAASVNDEVIKTWKEAHPRGVWRLAVNSDEVIGEKEDIDSKGKKSTVDVYEQKIGYVRKPTRIEISAAMTVKNDPIGQVESLFRDSWLGGDEELLDDDDYFQGAILQFQDLIQIRTGEIKKL